jgi:hypothetical protein
MIEFIHMPSLAERASKFRCRANTDGTMNCSTKIEGNKGKKVYRRNQQKRELSGELRDICEDWE